MLGPEPGDEVGHEEQADEEGGENPEVLQPGRRIRTRIRMVSYVKTRPIDSTYLFLPNQVLRKCKIEGRAFDSDEAEKRSQQWYIVTALGLIFGEVLSKESTQRNHCA